MHVSTTLMRMHAHACPHTFFNTQYVFAHKIHAQETDLSTKHTSCHAHMLMNDRNEPIVFFFPSQFAVCHHWLSLPSLQPVRIEDVTRPPVRARILTTKRKGIRWSKALDFNRPTSGSQATASEPHRKRTLRALWTFWLVILSAQSWSVWRRWLCLSAQGPVETRSNAIGQSAAHGFVSEHRALLRREAMPSDRA